MAVLLASDLPTDAALDAIQGSGTHPKLQAFAADAKAAVLEGDPLSDALQKADPSMPRYFAAAVRAGETTGDLALVFEELANYQEDSTSDKSQLATAAQYLRTLSLIIGSKQTLVAAAENAADVLSIEKYKVQAALVTRAIQEGETLSDALMHLTVIPAVARQLLSAGEQSARLGKMSERAATLVENWLSNDRKRFAALLDPILMMVVGVMVLVIVLSVLLPIFDLQSVIGQ
jgi:type II secretory pathway component PulF